MKKLIFSILFLSLAALAQQKPAEEWKVTILRVGTLIDGISSQPKSDQMIIIEGNRIKSVADYPKGPPVKPAPGTRQIDLSEYTVLPGMIDAHTHIFLQGEDPAEGGYDVQLLKYPISYRSVRASVSAQRALEQGFTTIRDLETEGAGYGDMGIKRAVNEGIIPGPRIFGVTRAISSTGGYPLEGYNPDIVVPKGAQLIDGPVEARKAAREQLDNGADWIKVYMTHRSWVDKAGHLQSQPTLTLDEIKAIVDETHGWGKKVACHAYNGIGLQRALDGGCDSIEHGLELTDANVAQMLKQGTWYCPTMAVYYSHWEAENTPGGQRDRKRAEVHMGSLAKAYKAGVKIAFGTDVGGFSWKEPIAQEFPYMIKAGMSPMDAIKAATSNAAELLDMKGEIGVIAPKAFADIIAVNGDPLADVAALREVRFVMKDGKVFAQQK